jgi:hypothetical protein
MSRRQLAVEKGGREADDEIVMIFLLLLIIVAAALVAAGRYGSESRPVFDERPEAFRFGALR